MRLSINGTEFTLTTTPRITRSVAVWSPVRIDGAGYDVDDKERLQSIAHSQAEELEIKCLPLRLPNEITILDRVWLLNDAATYSRKIEIVRPSLPFPHAGQTVSLDGVDVEVCHVTNSGVVFWYNPGDDIYGVVKAEKLKSTLAETMRADLAKGLGPKELIAIGWSRKL